jgi:hypothetical protein
MEGTGQRGKIRSGQPWSQAYPGPSLTKMTQLWRIADKRLIENRVIA